MKKGFTLVECMLASSIFCLMTLVLFEGVIVSTRIAHENADILSAEAVAWDAVWKRFNEPVADLKAESITETLSEDAAPQLYSEGAPPPKITVTVRGCDLVGWESTMRRISADVEWGPAGRRRRLSDCNEVPVVYRGNQTRAWPR